MPNGKDELVKDCKVDREACKKLLLQMSDQTHCALSHCLLLMLNFKHIT